MNKQEFIQTIGPLIVAEAKKRGYHVASPIIAQACCESNYGASGLSSSRYHNYFGLKCGSYWKGPSVNMKTKEEYNSQLVSIRDNFRVYSSMEEGVKGYFDFISTKRYANLKDATTPQQYLEYIKADGYATSSSYVATCMKYVTLHNLTSYDWETSSVDPTVNPYPVPTRLLKKGCRGEDVRWLQWVLKKRDYPVGNIDGIFGVKTEEAVRQFQMDVFVDKIVGPLTLEKLK